METYTHEKIISIEGQNTIKIVAGTWHYQGEMLYKVWLLEDKGDGEWGFVFNPIDHPEFKSLGGEEKDKYEEKHAESIVGAELVYQVKLEVWEKIKPAPPLHSKGILKEDVGFTQEVKYLKDLMTNSEFPPESHVHLILPMLDGTWHLVVVPRSEMTIVDSDTSIEAVLNFNKYNK